MRGTAESSVGVEGDDLEAFAGQVEKCWLRCGDCGARRIVERGSLASLRSEKFQKVQEGSERGFWGQWLGEARSRYDAFVETWGGESVTCMPCDAGAGAAGEMVAPGGGNGGTRDVEMSDPGGSDSDSAAGMRTDVRMGLEEAKLKLGSFAGGLDRAEQAELESLYQRDRQAMGGQAGGSVRAGVAQDAMPRNLQFRCSMLQREVTWRRAGDGVLRRRWETMRCRAWNEEAEQWEGGDEDDFDALHRMRWSREDFVEGSAVMLLRPLGLGGEPGSKLWARYGRVAALTRGQAEERGVVILRLREERSREWCAHEQVHVAFLDRLFRPMSAVCIAWRDWVACLAGSVYDVLGRMLGADGASARIQVEPRDV